MTNRRYMSQLNAALERKNASERKINSTKRYNRASEDPISAAKALRTRKAISNTNDYLGNLETAEQIYNGADSVLMNVNDILDNIIERLHTPQTARSMTKTRKYSPRLLKLSQMR